MKYDVFFCFSNVLRTLKKNVIHLLNFQNWYCQQHKFEKAKLKKKQNKKQKKQKQKQKQEKMV